MYPQDKIEFFTRRSLNQSMEAAFDFVRQNRAAWLKASLLYLLPYAVVVALVLLPNKKMDGYEHITEIVFRAFRYGGDVIYLLPGIFLASLFSVSLLRKYLEQDADSLSWRKIVTMAFPPFVKVLLATTLLCAVIWMVATFVNTSAYRIMLLVVFMPPLCFVLPSLTLGGNGIFNGVEKAVRYGFKYWFKLAGTLLFMMSIAFMVGLSFQLPCTLLAFLSEFLGLLGESFKVGFWDILCVVDMASVIYAFLMGCSFVVLAVSFLYGSADEENADRTLSDDIDNFENL